MGHGFNNLGRNTTFASRRELAWHKLGSVVDSMTSKEAMILGGLDFEVGLAPIYAGVRKQFPGEPVAEEAVRNKEKEYYEAREISTNFATYRKDTLDVFGVVGSRYTPVQNTEAFDFFDDIIGEGHAEYETVGALGNGETVFITAKLPSKLLVNKEDIDKYLLLTMSHDGTGSIQAMFTPIRVVCNNTLSAAVSSNTNKVAIRHTKSATQRLKIAGRILGIVDKESQKMEELFNTYARKTVADPIAYEIMEAAFNMKRGEDDELSTRTANKLEKIKRYYHTGVGQKEIEGTAWGVYNGITGYLQNVEKKKSDSHLFKDSYLGRDEITRSNAINQINKLVL